MAVKILGDFAAGDLVRFSFNTVGLDSVPITLAGVTTQSHFAIAKDGSDMILAADTVTVSVNAGSVTGYHVVTIDTTKAGFDAGSDYEIRLAAGTVDSISVVGAVLATWSIENKTVSLLKDGTITANTFDTGVLATDADIADAVLDELVAEHATAGSLGAAITTLDTNLTTVDDVVDAILLDTGTQGVLLAANAIGDAVIQDNAITANKIANDAITAAKIATGAITNAKFAASAINAAAIDTGAITSAKFATGAITSTVLADNAITAAKIQTDAIDADALATDAIAEIADQVWREDITTHTAIADSTAEALNAASSAGDPWNTTLPGTYTAGKAGNILANVNTQIGTAGAGLTAIPWNAAWDAEVQSECADAITASLTATEVSAIKAVTDLLTASQAEPSGVPAANETPLEKLAYIFMALRNKLTVTASAMTFHDDSESPEWKKVLSDDGTTYTEGEATTP